MVAILRVIHPSSNSRSQQAKQDSDKKSKPLDGNSKFETVVLGGTYRIRRFGNPSKWGSACTT